MPSVTSSSETRASIYSIFSNGLARVILNEDITDMTTKSTFQVEELTDTKVPMALFIITRDEAPQAYATVVSTMIDAIYTKLIDLCHTKFNDTLPRPCHFILEEFGNISKLTNINDMMTASRSRNIRMVLVVQSLCQLQLNYSKELAQVMIGNSQNLVFLSSSDMELVELISKRCGTVSDTYTNERRPLLSPERLTHLNKKLGETLFLLDRQYPYVSFLPDLSKYKCIEPLEKVEWKKRKRVKLQNSKWKETVDKMLKEKRQEMQDKLEEMQAGLFDEDYQKNRKEQLEIIQENEMTKEEMLSNSEELLEKLNKIIYQVLKEEENDEAD